MAINQVLKQPNAFTSILERDSARPTEASFGPDLDSSQIEAIHNNWDALLAPKVELDIQANLEAKEKMAIGEKTEISFQSINIAVEAPPPQPMQLPSEVVEPTRTQAAEIITKTTQAPIFEFSLAEGVTETITRLKKASKETISWMNFVGELFMNDVVGLGVKKEAPMDPKRAEDEARKIASKARSAELMSAPRHIVTNPIIEEKRVQLNELLGLTTAYHGSEVAPGVATTYHQTEADRKQVELSDAQRKKAERESQLNLAGGQGKKKSKGPSMSLDTAAEGGSLLSGKSRGIG